MRKISCCLLGITTLLIHTIGCGHSEGTGPVYDEVSTGTGTAISSGTGGGCATSTGVSGSSASSTGAGGAGGRACIAPTNGCGGPDQCGPSLPIVQIKENVPVPLGGVVEDGTYWITAVNEYTGVGSAPLPDDGPMFGGTYVFAAGTLASTSTTVFAGGPAETLGEAGTFVTSGTSITQSSTCGNGSSTSTYDYTVAGGTLHFYSKNKAGDMELVLVKQ